MNTKIIIDTTYLNFLQTFEYSLKPLYNNKSALNILLEKLSKLSFDKILFIPENKITDEIKILCDKTSTQIELPDNDISSYMDFLKELSGLTKKLDIDNIILTYGDSPLLDVDEINTIYKLHSNNLTEYTFGENYVEGIVPEIMSKKFLEKITSYDYKKPEILSRRIFDNTTADINKFFIEVNIAKIDFSIKRIELTANSKRNFILLENLFKHITPEFNYIEIYNIINKKPEILHIFPKYIEMEITNNCNLNCTFCPRKLMERNIIDMDFNLYKKIIDEVSDKFNDIILSYSLFGEPFMHPEFEKFVNYTLNDSAIFSLIIETNAVLLDDNKINFLSKFPANKLILIFGIDAVSEELYGKLRKSSDNKNYFTIVKNNIEKFLTFNDINKYRSFVQILKMQDNLLEIENFYNYWKQFTDNIIIQKYNSYINKLPNKTVSDLTPLDRFPCWHLQRDMQIFSNGKVPVCKQIINNTNIIGDLNNISVSDIWKLSEEYFLANYKNNFNKIPICKECDEWYTFNF